MVVLGRHGPDKTFSFRGECKPLSSDNTSMTTQLNPVLRHGASVSLIALIVLCLLWELKIDPLRPGGSLLALDRKRVVWGKSVAVRVDLGGRRIIKKKNKN